MGIENCRVLGIESGRVGPLSRGGSVATGAGRPPGSAGVSPALVSAQSGPSPQPDSTGNRASVLLWPHTRRSCPRGWPVHHRRRSARYAAAVHAGETPALPGGASPPHCSRHSPALFLQPDSSGNRARALLRPHTHRSCRRGWPVHHRRRSARFATAVHAGETLALPGGASLPQCSRHSLPFFSNPTRPAIAPAFCFGRTHGVPARGAGRCTIAGVLRDSLRQCMRARRSRSRVGCLFRIGLGSARPFSSNPTQAAIAPGLCFGRAHAVPVGGVGGNAQRYRNHTTPPTHPWPALTEPRATVRQEPSPPQSRGSDWSSVRKGAAGGRWAIG